MSRTSDLFHPVRGAMVSRRRLFAAAAAATVGGLGLQTLRESSAAAQGTSPLTGATAVLVRDAALVITMDPALGEGLLGTVEGADLLWRGDSIAAVGKDLVAPDATVLDARGKIVLPGFVDTHNHLWQSLFRGGCSGDDLRGWFTGCNLPLLRTLDDGDAYNAERLSTLDVISTGVTTVVDWAGNHRLGAARGYVRALNESGLRYVFAYGQPAPDVDNIARLKRELIDSSPLATFQVSAGAGMPGLDTLRLMHRQARDLGVKLNIHLLQNFTDRDIEHFRSLEEAGALAPNLVVNHAIHLTDEEIAKLAAHDVRVAHNPLSNMRLASGIMRLPELHAAGVKVGLGLDGASNDTSDMFATMRAAVGLQRANSLRADIYPSVPEVLRMATLGGAEVLDMADRIGSLTPGKKADVLVLDPSGVNFAPRWDWISQIVFNAQPDNVEYVFVGGQPLKAAGQFVGVSPADVVRAAEESARRLREVLQP
jgi:5-methylthioadenosine/S-adenosylhomocysteine deaminase